MNKTELAILLTRERVKAQLEALGTANLQTEKGIAITTGIKIYDQMLQQSLRQLATPAKPKETNGHCWYCGELGFSPKPIDDGGHPYYLCIFCGATTMMSERYPKKHKPLYQPYMKLGREVARLIGNARKAKLPPGYYQHALPMRCN